MPLDDIDFDGTASVASMASTMTSIINRGQVDMDVQQDFDSDGNKSKKDTFLETLQQLELDDEDGEDGGDGWDSDIEGIDANEHEEGMYIVMMEKEEEADHTVHIPINHGSAGYVEYIKSEQGCDVSDPSQIKLPSIPED